MTVIFDKLTFSKPLEAESAFDRRQAEALTEALHDAISEGIATKQDVVRLMRWTPASVGVALAIVGACRFLVH